MKIIFLGTGPTEPVIKDSRTRSSIYIESSVPFLVDASLDFEKQVKREGIKKIAFILQTHAHKDAMGGLSDQLKSWMKENNIEKMPIYVEKETWSKIKERIADTEHLEPKFFEPYSSFSPEDSVKITPFRVIHSIQPGFPAVGFRINDIVYSEDVGEIPEESQKYYKNADTIIFDAAMWFNDFIKGHYNVEMALEEAKKFHPRLFILTQAGHTYPGQKVAEKEIEDYWDIYREDVDTKIKLAYDGLQVSSSNLVSLDLFEEKYGIYLTKPHGRMIWEGKKDLIVKSKLFRTAIGKTLYLIEDNLCYGIIKLGAPYKIDMEEFKRLYEKHRITDEERRKWWQFKQILFAYPFKRIKMFESPRKVIIPKGVQTFVKDFKFLEQELIQDVNEYRPEKIPLDVLKDDWRIVMAWYSSKRQGKSLIHSYDTIENLAKKIYKELKKKGIEFHPDTMTPNALELFNKIAEREDKMEESKKALDLTNYELLKEFKDMTITHDFVSIIGSYAEQREGHTPNDIDILVKMAKPTEYLRRSIEVRILKELNWPENWESKIHFVWGDAEGPHDTFIPLYDLMLKRKYPMIKVEMMDNSKKWISPEEYKELSIDFYSMKPAKKFYDINETVTYMFSVADKFAIEKKYNGVRGILEKKGDSVHLYSDEKRDISRNFKKIISQAENLSSKDFILDGEIVLNGGGRAEILKFVTGKMDLDDSTIQYHVFDVIELGEDISDKPWFERKDALHSLNFTENIKEVRSILVESSDRARKAITIMGKLPKSEGAVIKIYDGKYTKGTKTHPHSAAWIKYRIEDPINVTVLDVFQKENGYSYKLGIHIDKNDIKKFEDKYMEESALVLGNSFVTKKKFEKGDTITVLVEEVWRHEYKDGKIRYSIHKPTPVEKVNVAISKWGVLDDLAVSKGEQVIENLELEEQVTLENFVVKRGDKWCVVHGHPKKPGSKTDKPVGAIIKCFPTKEEADRMHKAIIISEIKRGEMQEAELNENFFSKWSSDMAYILGYLTADAHIYEDKTRLEMTSEDKQLLEDIRKKLGIDAVISPVEDYYIMRHVSHPMIEDLKKLGFEHYKPDRVTYKHVPKEYTNDYIRGVMDADGTLDDERNKLQIDNPNIGLITFVYKELKKIGKEGVHFYKYSSSGKEKKTNNMRKVAVTSNTELVLDWIYKGAKIYIKRKKKIADKIDNQDTTTETPGVSDVQKTTFPKKKLPIQKINQFDPKAMTIKELEDTLFNEGVKYNNIKYGTEKGSLENTILIGRMIYNELLRREVKPKLPDALKGYMDVIEEGKTGIMIKLSEEDDFGETRSEAAESFWINNWQNMYSKDGKGKFVLQNHWRGLPEDEIKMSNDDLLDTNHSIHSDLRWEIDSDKLAGFTIFLGNAKENKDADGNKFVYQSEHKTDPSKLRGGFKLEIPYAWLNVGKGFGTVSSPKEVGATSKKFAKFFIEDNGTYELGVMREHAVELFLHGNKIKGRVMMQYAPLTEGRNWLIDFPESQEPYVDTHKLEDVIKELKQKKQKWLIWAKPGEKPKKIDVEKWSEEKNEDVRYRSRG